MPNQQEFRFRYCPQKGTEDAYLIAYLMSYGLSERKEKIILAALRAFWLPLALKAANIAPEIITKIGWRELGNLDAQMNLLRNHLSELSPSLLKEWGDDSSKKSFVHSFNECEKDVEIPQKGLSLEERLQGLQKYNI